MLKTRIISAIIGIPLLLGLLYLGGFYWLAFFILLGLLALYEYFSMMKKANLKPVALLGYCVMMILMLRSLLGPQYEELLFLTAILLIVIVFIFKHPGLSLADIVFTFFGASYIGFLLGYAQSMRELKEAFLYILLALLLTWGCDIGGYLFGSLWGKNKLAPQLSPNKTWQGAIGGIILPVFIGGIFACLVRIPNLSLGNSILLAIVAGITAQFGDLFISGIKRYFGVKDSGNIIPGHGGVLDRFDSFLLVLPVVYFYIILIIE